MTKAARKEFRSKNNIPEDSFVILVAPGDTSSDIEFSFKAVNQGIKKFLAEKEIASYGKSNFHVLVLSSDQQVRSYSFRSTTA